MNKVYEGIFVRAKDGDITDVADRDTRRPAASPQRARDQFVRDFRIEIDLAEADGDEWDIIVREWK